MAKTLSNIAEELSNSKDKIHLIYAFNATGKTRLSVEYKNYTRDNHINGFYYNAFSEDLFVWDNTNVKLNIRECYLNRIHWQITEEKLKEKLSPYNPKYDFLLHYYDDNERGISSVSFSIKNDASLTPIKISRGEEKIFIWCFFLAIFDSSTDEFESQYIFIDDPISSIDEHNLFTTVFSIYELIEKNYETRKIIITTHHLALATVLSTWLTQGEKKDKFKKIHSISLLECNDGDYQLLNPKNEVLLYHLRILQIISEAVVNNSLEMYHFALLRQLLENISSFLGSGQFSYVLHVIGFTNAEQSAYADIINSRTHKNIYTPQQNAALSNDDKELIKNVFNKLKDSFQFII